MHQILDWRVADSPRFKQSVRNSCARFIMAKIIILFHIIHHPLRRSIKRLVHFKRLQIFFTTSIVNQFKNLQSIWRTYVIFFILVCPVAPVDLELELGLAADSAQAAANYRAAETAHLAAGCFSAARLDSPVVAGLDYASGAQGQFSVLFGLAAVFQASSLADLA